MSARQPAIFVTHGSPTLLLDDCPARDFLSGLGGTLGRPQAIVCVSAHWETDAPRVLAADRPETIHDFRGFPQELYEMTYPAPGDPGLAERTAALISEAGMPARTDTGWGFDHGCWMPLRLMYPDADLPVIQVSIQPDAGPAHHFRIGEALAPLREEGILVMGSGSATHNLAGFFGRERPALDAAPETYAQVFDDWLHETVEDGAIDQLLNYRALAPEAFRNHPTEDHFLPIFAAAGAGHGRAGRTLHRSFTFGMLSMAAFAWD
jgi:4,5-DOPA dioxygenase extradiol